MKKIKQKKQDIYYDKKTDVLWFNIKTGIEEEYKEVAPGVNLEMGKNGELLGIEILNASKVLGSKLGMKHMNEIQSTPVVTHRIR